MLNRLKMFVAMAILLIAAIVPFLGVPMAHADDDDGA